MQKEALLSRPLSPDVVLKLIVDSCVGVGFEFELFILLFYITHCKQKMDLYLSNLCKNSFFKINWLDNPMITMSTLPPPTTLFTKLILHFKLIVWEMVKTCLLDPLWKNISMTNQEISLERLKKKKKSLAMYKVFKCWLEY